MVIDLGKDPNDFATPPSSTEPLPSAGDKSKKPTAAKKGVVPEKGVGAMAPASTENKPSLMPLAWISKVKQACEVASLVSSAHRALVSERDAAIDRYYRFAEEGLADFREEYDVLLRQEESWNTRWKKQVTMLKNGQV
jgi:hypothetical protein